MLRQKLAFISIALVCILGVSMAQDVPKVPSKIQIADLKLTITEAARKDIQKDVNMLRSSEKFFRIKLDRVVLYMPVVERILKEENIPDDIKYLAIQESSFIPDAVSTSKAVGYWQFKDFTAREMGLRVDNKIDERKNIQASTVASAKYFKSHQKQLDNWANSINAHMTGATGIKKYISPGDKGAKKMTITKKTHWYLKRFIAHKIAFQNELDHENSKGIELLEYKDGAGKDLAKIAKQFKIEEDQLKTYNKWLIHGRIPGDKRYVVMVPVQKGNQKARQLADNSGPIARKNAAALNDPEPNSEVIYPKGQVASFVEDQSGVVKINGVKAIMARAGEDFESLLARSGLKEKKLLKFNDLGAPTAVNEGDIYFIKKKKKKSSIGFYTVARGESLWDVAQKQGMRLSALLKKNRMSIRDIPKPGRVLWLSKRRPAKVEVEYQELVEVIDKPAKYYQKRKETSAPVTKPDPEPEGEPEKPDSDPEATQTKPKPVTAVEKFNTHIVAAEETLWRIAKAYDVTVEDILQWNNLAVGSALSIGQALLIDAKKALSTPVAEEKKKKKATKVHVVRGGDTFYNIARKYDMNVNDLLKLNDMDDTAVLSIGQELQVAKRSDSKVDKKEASPTKSDNSQVGLHQVKAGETFYGIARTYGMNVKDLLALNELDNGAVLSPGQELRVSSGMNNIEEPQAKKPVKASRKKAKVHRVKAGETFYGIARKYGMELKDLLNLNGLDDNAVLSVGQELQVASSEKKQEMDQPSGQTQEKATATHTVQPGETLYGIARKYDMTIDELKQLNNKTDNSLALGEELKVYR